MSLEQITLNLAKEIEKIKGATVTGLYKAGLMIEREAIKRAPKDTGNMRNSFLTIKENNHVEIKNKANYSLYVHENMEARHPIGEAKFLENAIKAKQDEALKIIAENAEKAI